MGVKCKTEFEHRYYLEYLVMKTILNQEISTILYFHTLFLAVDQNSFFVETFLRPMPCTNLSLSTVP